MSILVAIDKSREQIFVGGGRSYVREWAMCSICRDLMTLWSPSLIWFTCTDSIHVRKITANERRRYIHKVFLPHWLRSSSHDLRQHTENTTMVTRAHPVHRSWNVAFIELQLDEFKSFENYIMTPKRIVLLKEFRIVNINLINIIMSHIAFYTRSLMCDQYFIICQ